MTTFPVGRHHYCIIEDIGTLSIGESEIDRLVYQLYDLTYDEVLIVALETPITKEEYESSNK